MKLNGKRNIIFFMNAQESGWKSVTHPFLPIYDMNSRILILGSLPSVKSREENFYYGNPKNRFWKVLAKVFSKEPHETTEEKTALILENRLALWDAIYKCDIKGSSDRSIRNAAPANLFTVINNSRIEHIFCNGKTAFRYYNMNQIKTVKIEAECLPSTSPANAAWTFEKLVGEWKSILDCLIKT